MKYYKKKICKKYNISFWGEKYYDIDDNGNIIVFPDPINMSSVCVNLTELANDRKKNNQRFPVLFCFPQILRDRLYLINQSFKKACKLYQYTGNYFLVYPIKVNQQKRIIESLMCSKEKFGLEAGSKSELIVVLTYAINKPSIIICNGYKDREYISLAIISTTIGHKVYLVIEKISEIFLILEESKRLNIKPSVGIRIRLAAKNIGKWELSSGEKSKFGLTTSQILKLINILKQSNQINILELLHFHIGSQVPNIKDIISSVKESIQFFVELNNLGVKIKCLDIGGGLGVDYEGTRSKSDYSVNYSVYEYAKNIIYIITQACKKYGLKHPIIITESGRALTAHHAVLISNIIETEKNEHDILPIPPKNSIIKIKEMWNNWQVIKKSKKSSVCYKLFRISNKQLLEIQNGYSLGLYSLKERAWAEQLHLYLCFYIQKFFKNKKKYKKKLIELEERIADKIYVNFSLFQSLPDSWGINQIFPILPLEGLNEKIKRKAIIFDITCDSDGKIERYIDENGVRTTISMPRYNIKKPPLIGFFMVGAYQEILGNMHNLFGNVETVNINLYPNKKIKISVSNINDTVKKTLNNINVNPEETMHFFYNQLKIKNLDEKLFDNFILVFKKVLYGYTYLKEIV
ncbi:biosynthetic arginine decarboxylase [Candidatus Tachikawaea gelatinosa]|uniref:Arginine decarboxylase n=1 Tax=Candidatus Tachikawaea gelatinosa TaxID=1410383 RepID=A0A090AS45_9ENTR|nr:biosynthetic arginine decarboxylase [Candidatus Tachikawaea gelatinosa]BAP58680.1 biosynthetic arginine decarboxylase [Candidatus Tachikawaea gelatinosa]